LSYKAVHIWVEKRGKRFARDEEVETELRKWLRQQPKNSVLRVKKWANRINVGGGYVETKMFSSGPNIIRFMFRVHL
jgi:hypothetical protein